MKGIPGRQTRRLYRIIRRQAVRMERLSKEIRKLERRLNYGKGTVCPR